MSDNSLTEEDTLEMVVTDGIQFLESITRHYGPEQGIEVWNKLGEAFGDEIKGRVFFTMLTGEHSCRVWFRDPGCNSRIDVIKAIRGATGLSLKEAKALSDAALQQRVAVKTTSRSASRELVRDLRDVGCIIG